VTHESYAKDLKVQPYTLNTPMTKAKYSKRSL